MKKNKWKSKRWVIVWISEIKYNPYKDVDVKKRRPVLIWNNALSLNGKVICFHCTSKNNNKKFCYQINQGTKIIKPTWVDMRKIYFVSTKDIDWKNKLGRITDQEAKHNIKQFIKTYFYNLDE